eukprot:6459253-Amphidinium_carterae.2
MAGTRPIDEAPQCVRTTTKENAINDPEFALRVAPCINVRAAWGITPLLSAQGLLDRPLAPKARAKVAATDFRMQAWRTSPL